MSFRHQLAFAADLELEKAVAAYAEIEPFFGVAKVGLSLFVEHGPNAVKTFRDRGAQVFLDLKLHDIPNTVERAASNAGALGVRYLTVHAGGGVAMMKAAVQGAKIGAELAGHKPPIVLAVTVLTSMNDEMLNSVGVPGAAKDQVTRLAALAQKAGVGGLVCSAQEVAALRQLVGPEMTLCTPGIRLAGDATHDQSRVESPGAALKSGATLLVIGRPISEAPDRRVAAQAIVNDIGAVMSAR